MTAVVLTPDLQRIVEALKACRERYVICRGLPEEDYYLFDRQEGFPIVTGSWERCQDVFDVRRAEAMVLAVRKPSDEMLEAADALSDLLDEGGWIDPPPRTAWPAMCDAILGETQL